MSFADLRAIARSSALKAPSYASGLGAEVGLDYPARRAADAQAQSKAGQLIVEIGPLAHARRQCERLDRRRSQPHRTCPWAGYGQIGPASSYPLMLLCIGS